METQEKTFSGIVMYTIHEDDNKLRNFVQKRLEKEFDGIPLDQSTYGIAMGSKSPAIVKKRLEEICNEAVTNNAGNSFVTGDFVTLYYVTETEIKGSKEWRITRSEIIKI